MLARQPWSIYTIPSASSRGGGHLAAGSTSESLAYPAEQSLLSQVGRHSFVVGPMPHIVAAASRLAGRQPTTFVTIRSPSAFQYKAKPRIVL
jgi:hypothetical protein